MQLGWVYLSLAIAALLLCKRPRYKLITFLGHMGGSSCYNIPWGKMRDGYSCLSLSLPDIIHPPINIIIIEDAGDDEEDVKRSWY